MFISYSELIPHLEEDTLLSALLRGLLFAFSTEYVCCVRSFHSGANRSVFLRTFSFWMHLDEACDHLQGQL